MSTMTSIEIDNRVPQAGLVVGVAVVPLMTTAVVVVAPVVVGLAVVKGGGAMLKANIV